MSSKVCRGCFLVLDLDNFTRGFNQRYRKVCKKCTEKRRADSRRYICKHDKLVYSCGDETCLAEVRERNRKRKLAAK